LRLFPLAAHDNLQSFVQSLPAVPYAFAAASGCPPFGQPGWGPLCFLNGNPLFQGFDLFQAFVQHSIVLLHDQLQVKS
jgi:hypothetical protein